MSTETFGHLRDESVAYVRPPELDEAERVWAEGDEGELRESLGPMINKVEELVGLNHPMFNIDSV
jgi:hypothetical protein